MSEADEEPPLDYSETDMVEEETAVITTTTTTTKDKEDTSRDELLPVLNDDPRGKANAERQRVGQKSGGRNTESFDPKSTLVRPEMRILVGPNQEKYGKPLKHDDVVIVPDFFCKEDDWSLYYKLIEEMRSVQAEGSKQSEWISWHEGAHLITKNPMDCPSFKAIQDKISAYFNIAQKSVGTRFNWYRDSSDWKPFHHDSAAFNPQRAKNQNITVGVSFGASRELAFIHADNKSRIYFPQTNGMMFSFGRDVNIKWKHGVNALHVDEQDGKGRVSIILWGLCPDVIEEKNSPRMISNDRNFGGKGGKGGGGRGGGGKGGRPDDRRGFDRDRSRDRNRDFRDRSRDRDNRDRSRDMGRGRGDDRDFDRGRNGDRSRGQSRDRDGRMFERDDRDDRNRGDYRRERADSRGGPREGGGRDSNYRGNNDNYRGNGGDNYNRPRDGDNRPRENERNDKRPRQSDEGSDARSSGRKNDGDKVTGDNSRDNNRNKKPKVLDKDKPCFSFQKGDCKYGDTCKYSH